MTPREAFKRAIATFVAGAASSLSIGPLLGVAVWRGAAMAGAGALINYVWRLAEAYRDGKPLPPPPPVR